VGPRPKRKKKQKRGNDYAKKETGLERLNYNISNETSRGSSDKGKWGKKGGLFGPLAKSLRKVKKIEELDPGYLGGNTAAHGRATN